MYGSEAVCSTQVCFSGKSPAHCKSLYNNSLLIPFLTFQKYNYLCCLFPPPVELKATQM